VTPPALYTCELRHLRTAPVRHGFEYRTYLWLVDLDEIPRLPAYLRPLARFQARDHLGDPHLSIRRNVERFLAEHGIDLRGGTVLMLCQARILGHVFNPLTLYWCRSADGTPTAVVAEVHNTYGERHCYLLRPDARQRAKVDKAFYVSPFFAVDGRYQMRLPEPTEHLAVTITLHRAGRLAFAASLHGSRHPLTTVRLLRLFLRHPWESAWVSLRIRRQGIRLLLHGLPLQPRPPHPLTPAGTIHRTDDGVEAR
jgi:uncharacterized protein